MKIHVAPLARDLAGATSAAFFVLQVDHEHGTAFLADRPGTIGGDPLVAAVIEFNEIAPGAARIVCAADALPAWLDYWPGRPARIWEIPPDAEDLGAASVVAEGEVAGQPERRGADLEVELGPRRLKPVRVPAGAPIDAAAWPQASDDALGSYAPEIYGTVPAAGLFAVQLPAYAALAEALEPNATALPVDDATVFPASGQVVVDGVTYAYASRTETELLGVAVTRPHAAGTAVAVPGAATFLAAGHAVQAIGARKSGGVVVPGGAVDLQSATVSYASLPTAAETGDLFTRFAEFDAVDPATTAADGANAIQAATGQVTQTVGASTITAGDAFEFIAFPRPAPIGGTSTIIQGGYTVTFTVTHTSAGRVSVTIGNALVYVAEGGAVIYDASPAGLFYDENTDQLPVSFEAPDGDSVTLEVASAERTVTLGNDDAAAYATLDSSGSVLAVTQSTAMAERGRIQRARLAVEFWLSDSLQAGEEIAVSWRGNRIGALRQVNDGQTSQDATVSFDLSQVGSANLQNNNISVSASGGTTTLNNVPTFQKQTYTMAYDPTGFSGIERARVRIVPPDNVKAGVHTVRATTKAISSQRAILGIHDDVSGGFGSSSRTLSAAGNGGTGSSGFYVAASGSTTPVGVSHDWISGNEDKFASLEVDWEVNPISNSDTPASAFRSYPNRNVPLSGSFSGGSTITLPAPPRTVINYFDLPERAWSAFTGQTAELALATSRSALAARVARVVLLIEYRPIVRRPAVNLTAEVTGRSGNPADVVADLAGRLGDRLAPLGADRLRRWAGATGYAFARRIAEPTDATRLLNEATEQALARPVETSDGLRLVRRLDPGRAIVTLDPADLLEPAQIAWTPVDDATTRVDVRTGRGRLVSRGRAGGDRWANVAWRQVRRDQAVEVRADWIGDDAVASTFAADWLRLNAPLRRRLGVALPYTYAHLEAGDLLAFEGVTYEATATPRDRGGYLDLSAIEIPGD